MATSFPSNLEEPEVIIQLGGLLRQAASRQKDRFALTLIEPAVLVIGDIRYYEPVLCHSENRDITALLMKL
jgi:hypothetical protein